MTDAQTNVKALRDIIARFSDADRAFRTGMSPFLADLDRILVILKKTPDAFRQDRAFFLAKSKSLREAVALYADVKGTEDQAAIDAFLTKLVRAGGMIKAARQSLDASLINTAMVDIDVLSEQAAPTPTPAPTTWSRSALSFLRGQADAGYGMIVDKTLATGSVLTSLISETGEFFGRNLTDPVMARAQAAYTAGGSAIGSGAVAGIVIGVLCPPLLPVAGGVAALAAIEGWNAEMEAQNHLRGADRERRLKEIRDARKRAIAQITGGDTALMSETDDISLVVDGETGTRRVTLLSGPHAGRVWTDLTVREQAAEERRLRDKDALDTISILDVFLLAAA